jgi:hypothetical protein
MSLEQKLTKLNIDIGEAEKARDREWLKPILDNDLIFRRANGIIVNKETYLKDLENPENTYNYLCSEVVDVKLSASQDTAIVILHVRAKGKRAGKLFEGIYRNTRFFRREGQDWKCYTWFNEPLESLSKNDAYNLYESGKKRRYELLFAVNGGAFAIAQLLAKPDGKERILGQLTLTHLAIGMFLFTIIMCFDIFMFGENMRTRYLAGEVFGRPGKIVLIAIGVLICLGWLLVVFGFPIPVSKQSAALVFPLGFLGIWYLFPK